MLEVYFKEQAEENKFVGFHINILMFRKLNMIIKMVVVH